MSKLIDLTGQKFGELTVLQKVYAPDKRTRWLCECTCGNRKVVLGQNLKRGFTTSCGCKRYVITSAKLAKHHREPRRLFNIWVNMRARCNRKSDPSYKRYGARGITVCDEWMTSFVTFRDWALSHGYSPKLSIDRIDNNGNYEPSNCRWATNTQQSNNKRNNVVITYAGETHTLTEWGRLMGVPKPTMDSRRARRWPVERMLKEYDKKQITEVTP